MLNIAEDSDDGESEDVKEELDDGGISGIADSSGVKEVELQGDDAKDDTKVGDAEEHQINRQLKEQLLNANNVAQNAAKQMPIALQRPKRFEEEKEIDEKKETLEEQERAEQSKEQRESQKSTAVLEELQHITRHMERIEKVNKSESGL